MILTVTDAKLFISDGADGFQEIDLGAPWEFSFPRITQSRNQREGRYVGKWRGKHFRRHGVDMAEMFRDPFDPWRANRRQRKAASGIYPCSLQYFGVSRLLSFA